MARGPLLSRAGLFDNRGPDQTYQEYFVFLKTAHPLVLLAPAGKPAFLNGRSASDRAECPKLCKQWHAVLLGSRGVDVAPDPVSRFRQ